MFLSVADSLFFKIHDDISAIVEHGKNLLKTDRVNFIMEEYENAAFVQSVQNALANDTLYIVSDPSSLQTFLTSRNNEYFIIYGELLAQACLPFISPTNSAVVTNDSVNNLNFKQITMSPPQKIEAIVSMLLSAINHIEDVPHIIKLSPT